MNNKYKLNISIIAALIGWLSLPAFAAIKDGCELTPRWAGDTVYTANEQVQY